MSEIYTYNDFLEDLKKRQIPLGHELIKNLSGILGEYVNPEKVGFFYGKNLFVDGEKLLYFFQENKIVEVKIQGRNVEFRVHKQKIVDVEFSHPFYQDSPANLKLTLENGEILEFDSKKDASSKNWYSSYVEAIKTIFKFILQ
ncbi:hypothetical protein AF332_20645 [Sporosarcina globispora]|uniref:Uncharacterized protein n=1 Tax=Sporosarcina globispora TaxID=1459 RepID=A0A0M0GGS7_SPOGL|nr:DUF3908 family protein [Sporosarcina globispora]KON88958.1 hypothetical protein AF332_20645 [Sporosarcina globispora]